jgi:hypothetical protein
MTFLCPHCGRIVAGHILTDTQMEDHEMQVEGLQAKLDYAKGQLANIQKWNDAIVQMAALIRNEAEGD